MMPSAPRGPRRARADRRRVRGRRRAPGGVPTRESTSFARQPGFCRFAGSPSAWRAAAPGGAISVPARLYIRGGVPSSSYSNRVTANGLSSVSGPVSDCATVGASARTVSAVRHRPLWRCRSRCSTLVGTSARALRPCASTRPCRIVTSPVIRSYASTAVGRPLVWVGRTTPACAPAPPAITATPRQAPHPTRLLFFCTLLIVNTSVELGIGCW